MLSRPSGAATPPSLLDRLLDDFPEEQNPRDPGVAAEERRRLVWEAWLDSLRRDLGMLLSTRAAAGTDAARALPRAAESVARYGLVPALSGHGLSGAPKAILAAVAAFEPRFRNPRLLPGNAKDEASLVCAIAGEVEWNGTRRDLLAKVFSEGDGWKVELYE